MSEHENKHERTCVGCGKRAAPEAMIRLVLAPSAPIPPGHGGRAAPHTEAEGAQATTAEGGARGAAPLVVAVDAAGGGFGRGAHVHPSVDCIEKAAKGGLSRAFKKNVATDPKALGAAIREAYERRAVGLVLGARRAGHLEVGADAAAKAYAQGAPLVVLAADAGTVTKRFDAAIAAGRAACLGTKAALGEIFGSGETAVFAVRHPGVAAALSHVLSVAAGAGER